MAAWVVGHNMQGYMPESEPYATASWIHARDIMVSDLEHFAESLFDAADDVAEGVDHSKAPIWGYIEEAKKAPLFQDISVLTEGMAWWVTWSEDAHPDD